MIATGGELAGSRSSPVARSDMSERPPPPNRFLELFEEGKRFTEDLLRENEKLRLLITKIKDEKKDLELRGAGADATHLIQKSQVLEQEVQNLKTELASLRSELSSVENENREFVDRYVRLERQNNDLLSMYVATYRLHSTLDSTEVVGTIKEIVINLVGSEVFGVYVVDETSQRLTLVAHEGLDPERFGSARVGEGLIGKAAAAGKLWVAPPETDLKADTGQPIAVIPLKIGERVIGAIAIFRLLMQKDAFGAVDYELFELLGGHAATALYVTNLYSLSERKRSTLEGFIDLLKTTTPAGS
jgi:hypothetical protein